MKRLKGYIVQESSPIVSYLAEIYDNANVKPHYIIVGRECGFAGYTSPVVFEFDSLPKAEKAAMEILSHTNSGGQSIMIYKAAECYTTDARQPEIIDKLSY